MKTATIEAGDTVMAGRSEHGFGGSITVQAICPHCLQTEQASFITATDVVRGVVAHCRRYGTPYRLTYSIEALRIAQDLCAPEQTLAEAIAFRTRSEAPTQRAGAEDGHERTRGNPEGTFAIGRTERFATHVRFERPACETEEPQAVVFGEPEKGAGHHLSDCPH